MTKLSELLTVSINEGAVIDFESSLDKDPVVSGYVPVKSTLEVFSFLKQAAAPQAPQGRAIICHGSYGSGKSRLCTVLARLFRDGFDCPALESVWNRLIAREEQEALADLKQTLQPGGGAWRPWLVVPLYAQGGGGNLSASLIRALVKALRRAGLGEEVLGPTIYAAAAGRLEEMIRGGARYVPADNFHYATQEQLKRALEEDLDECALEEFRKFFKKNMFNMDFDATLLAADGVAAEAYGVYNTVAERIQTRGYAGIIVIWDEFGFALEEMLRDAHRGLRSLGQETMKLQEFVEKSCGNSDLGKRIVFLGFAHISIPEYGTRQRLNETDQDRLVTVSGRFRNPSINVRLSITETEGYHLLAGLLQRTEAGRQVFANPVPRLQRLADRMRQYQVWQRYTAACCYSDIAAPCYPMHPATATVLILLSDQIAQINRTTFYYLQDDGAGGLTGILRTREVSNLADIGGRELARVSDLFYFFEEAIRIGKRQLYDQYQEALARFPAANDIDKGLLRTVLVLSVVADLSLAPTTDFLCFCQADAVREELEAQPVHDALQRLCEAGSLWMNAATGVWRFVGGPGVGSEIDREVEAELELVPDHVPARLLLEFPELRDEIADRLGDFDIDPCDAGTVRRIGVHILDACKDEKAIEPVNPARNGSAELWRSALIYLVLADTPADLVAWRQRVATLNQPSVYFVFPPEQLRLDRGKIREMIAVRKVLTQKDSASHAYEVLDGRYTRLRRDLRQELDQAFGNPGLRSGTMIVPAGQGGTSLPVDSWNQLLPTIAADLDKQFCDQIRVRCGSFNRWQDGGNWSKIENVVKGILQFKACDQYWELCTGKQETSQEAAIVDGVLVENRLLKQEVPLGPWTLVEVDGTFPLVALRDVWKHFTTAGDREFSRLYSKLVEPPYGIPNAIIPIFVALVLRTEGSRIGIYESGGASPRRMDSDSRILDAIVDMAKHPQRYLTRYTKLTGPQRVVFRAIGPSIGLPLSNRQMGGEAFLEYCGQVRTKLVDWVKPLPEAILRAPELTELERGMLKLVKGLIPPQLPNLADALVEVVRQDAAGAEDLSSDAATRSFPAIEAKWRELHDRIERYVEGIKATVRIRIRDIIPTSDTGTVNPKTAFVKILTSFCESSGNSDQPFDQVVERLKTIDNTDVADAVTSAITGTPTAKLTEKDYARTGGYIEALSLIQEQQAKRHATGIFLVTLPSGDAKRLPVVGESQDAEQVTAAVTAWRKDLVMSVDQLAYLVLRALFSETVSSTSTSVDGQSIASTEVQSSPSEPGDSLIATSQQ